MDAMLTLYILGGGVALAALIFVVMSVVSAFRAPRLPELSSLQSQPLPQTFARALTPLPAPAAMISLSPMSESHVEARDRTPPRTVIALPALLGIAPATRAKSEPTFAGTGPFATVEHAAVASAPRAMMTSSPPIAARQIAMTPSAPPPIAARQVTVQTPVPTRIPVPLPTLVAPPQLPARMPRATTPRPITAVSTRVSWNEEEWRRSAPEAAQAATQTKVQTNAPAKSQSAARNNESTQRILRELPQPGLLRTVVGWTITTFLLAAAPVVVAPSIMDPLCGEGSWYGADATRLAREAARDANAAIDVSKLQVKP